MNVRNLFLMSMIFCAAPVVCAVSEPNLTKQEQEKIREWVTIIKEETSETQQIVKFMISMERDAGLLELSHIKLGKDKAAHRSELVELVKLLVSKCKHELEQLTKKLDLEAKPTFKWGKINGFMYSLPWIIDFGDFNALDSEKIITKKYIAIVRKRVAIYSFTFECL